MFDFVKIEVNNRQATLGLNRKMKALSPGSLVPFFTGEVTQYFQHAFAMGFQVEGRDTKWKPLSPDWTALEREAMGIPGTNPILQRRGISSEADSLKERVTHFKGEASIIGSVIEYQIPADREIFEQYVGHQLGISPNPIPGRKDIPARPMVELTRGDVAYILSRLKVHIWGG